MKTSAIKPLVLQMRQYRVLICFLKTQDKLVFRICQQIEQLRGNKNYFKAVEIKSGLELFST